MVRIGVICPSEIAYKRFLPALKKHKEIEYVGVACATKEEWFGEKIVGNEVYEPIKKSEYEKASKFVSEYGGKIFDGYENMITSGEIDAIYLPLPPALHYKWAKVALKNNLHVFVEKPSTTSFSDTSALVDLAKEHKKALHENYMFMFHSQIKAINDVIKSGEIGDLRLCRMDFGFPNRGRKDFRYNKALGGGALLDCGGYTFKYANAFLGGNAKIGCAISNFTSDYDVDVYGSATLFNENNEVVQVAFGMDNDYRCNIDVWGSIGTLKSSRVFTAPVGYKSSIEISKNGAKTILELNDDDSFYKSIQKFCDCIQNAEVRANDYQEMLVQEKLVNDFAKLSGLISRG